MKKVKRMMDGGISAPVPTVATAGLAHRPGMPPQGMPPKPGMPPQSNAGGAMRGPDRGAAMSGRSIPGMTPPPAVTKAPAPTAPAPAPAPQIQPAYIPPGGVVPTGDRTAPSFSPTPEMYQTGVFNPTITKMYKKGGKVKEKTYAKGGSVSSASKRGDGIAQRGKTKGRMV